jgi:hypothetical protein
MLKTILKAFEPQSRQEREEKQKLKPMLSDPALSPHPAFGPPLPVGEGMIFYLLPEGEGAR